MDQKKMPLIEALKAFAQKHPAYFCVPAHRYEAGVSPVLLEMLGPDLFKYDLTEAEGLDNLHAPEGAIFESQALAADLFGSETCFFLVNGTTSGNAAMILSTVGPGDQILVPSNVHRSVINALILSGAEPITIRPEYDEKWGIYTRLSPQTVEKALISHPEAKALFLVSPTYEGMESPVGEIAGVCHRHGVPLLVDEAHGSHFPFSDRLPAGAVREGADLVSQSLHKTGGSMTQSSLLHCQGNLVDPVRVRACVSLMTSTSPSYILMASLDAARHDLSQRGPALLEQALSLADRARAELSVIPGLSLLENDDLTRLVFSLSDRGMSGYDLQKLLHEKGNISLEMADEKNVTCVITWGNSQADIASLVQAVRAAAESCREIRQTDKAERRADGETAEQPELSEAEETAGSTAEEPLQVMTPREAFYAENEEVPALEAAGRISAQMIVTYPPGIPVVRPGQVIPTHVAKKCSGSVRVVRTTAMKK